MKREELIALIPAYALGALDREEQHEFEAWLAGDAEAQKLLAEYQALAEQIILTTPLRRAPTHLSDDLRQRLAAERTTSAALPHASSPSVIRRVLWTVALAAALTLVFGAILWQAAQSDPARLYERWSTQGNVMRWPIERINETVMVEGELVASPDGRDAVIALWQLPPISADQTFQLWLIDESGSMNGGLFRAADEGTTFVRVPVERTVTDYLRFGVSIEPEGGSPNGNRSSGEGVFRVNLES